MGTKDTVTAEYIGRNEIFADAFNFLIYDGKPVIRPESLVELDTREIGVPYGNTGAKQPVQRTRDVIKSVVAMTDESTAYLVLAVENQSHIHYAMPVKNLVYDALQYAKQVELASQSHRGTRDNMSSGEYLSGFSKDDRLIPVVTLVIYFGPEEWDGPLSIHEMLQVEDPRILSYVPDYRINLISPAAIAEENFEKFSSSLREVLSFLKYSQDRKKLDDLVNQNERFRHMGREEVNVISACTGVEIPIPTNEEAMDMCEAIREMVEEGRMEGLTEGRAEEKERSIEREAKMVKSLMTGLGVSAEKAMDTMSMEEADRENIRAFFLRNE